MVLYALARLCTVYTIGIYRRPSGITERSFLCTSSTVFFSPPKTGYNLVEWLYDDFLSFFSSLPLPLTRSLLTISIFIIIYYIYVYVNHPVTVIITPTFCVVAQRIIFFSTTTFGTRPPLPWRRDRSECSVETARPSTPRFIACTRVRLRQRRDGLDGISIIHLFLNRKSKRKSHVQNDIFASTRANGSSDKTSCERRRGPIVGLNE